MDLMVKLVLIFFVSLLSFSVGTFVGKQFSDSQHKLASMEHEGGDREVASVSPDATEVKPEEALSDEDIAHLTEEFVKTEKKEKEAGEAHAKAEHDGAHASATDVHEDKGGHGDKAGHGEKAAKVEKVIGTVSKNTHGAEVAHGEAHGSGHEGKVSDAAERVAHGNTPDPAPKPKEPSRVPTSLPDQVTAQTPPKFFVQVASYAREDEAGKRVEALKGQGFSAYSVKNEANGKIWYRIGIGAFATQTEAEEGLKKVRSTPGLNDAFIQKIVK